MANKTFTITIPKALVNNQASTFSSIASSNSSISGNQIDDYSIVNEKLQIVPAYSIKGNALNYSTTPYDLTGTEATSLLTEFVGDSGFGGSKGLVPTPKKGDGSKVLSGSGIWVQSGDVVGPTHVGDGDIVLFDQTTGKIIKGSGKTLEEFKAEVLSEAPGANPTDSIVFAIALG
jgi:hypothetical protein